jgi:hypothetical protein
MTSQRLAGYLIYVQIETQLSANLRATRMAKPLIFTITASWDEALDGAIASGSTSGVGETFEQLDELLVTLSASVGRS